MSEGQKKKIAGYSNAVSAFEYQNSLEQYYTNKRNEETIAKFKDKNNKDQWLQNEKIRQLQIVQQVDQYDKSKKLYNTTIKAIDFAAEDAEERVKLGLDEQIAQFAFEYDDLERDMKSKAIEAGFEYDAQQQQVKNATDNAKTELMNLNLQKAMIEDKEKRDSADLRRDYNYEQFTKTQKLIQDQGQARARGQSGKSAARQLQAMEAMNGIDQQAIADNLYYSTERLKADKKFAVGDENATKKYLKKGKIGLEQRAVKQSKRQQTKSAKLRQKQITRALGITSQEFEASREKLAEQLMSSSKAAELKLKQIQTKKFEAQGQAFAQKMLPPRFADSNPRPFKTPTTQYVKPSAAPEMPKMPAGGRGAQRSPSGASTALGIGSAVLGVAAPLTGPAAPFLMAGSGVLGGLSKLFQ